MMSATQPVEELVAKNLSSDQRAAHDGITSWLSGSTETKPVVSLAGYAGTGKSFLVSIVARDATRRGPVAFATYTGKASAELRRKLHEAGIATTSRTILKPGDAEIIGRKSYCGTIHGLIYSSCPACATEDLEHDPDANCDEADCKHGWNSRGDCPTCAALPACEACHPPIKPATGECSTCEGARWTLRSALDRDYSLIVIDEASMVADDMAADLKSFGIPILAVGDHGQLPPIRGVGTFMARPDFRLERIHRQAEGNPIIMLSKAI